MQDKDIYENLERELEDDFNEAYDYEVVDLGDKLFLEVETNEQHLIFRAKVFYEAEFADILLGARQVFAFLKPFADEKGLTYSKHFRVHTKNGLRTYEEMTEPFNKIKGNELKGLANHLGLMLDKLG